MRGEEHEERQGEGEGEETRDELLEVDQGEGCNIEVPDREVRDGDDEEPSAHQRRVKDEEAEVFVVRKADTVVCPRTVMVHLQSAALADAAVVRAIGLGPLALVAIPQAAGIVALRARYQGRICWHRAWIGKHALEIRIERQAEERQVDGELDDGPDGAHSPCEW